MRYTTLVDRVAGRGADVWRLHREAVALAQSGRDIILLTLGSADQAPPRAMIDAAAEGLREYVGYSPVVGNDALRDLIAARVRARTGMPCSTNNIVITAGAQSALYFVLQCLAGPGDEVIVPEPMYATYEAVGGASGARLVQVPLRPERAFHPDLDAMARAVTSKTRVIWINTPSNPTGSVFDRDEMMALAELCRRHDLWLLSDEVYAELAYGKPHVSAWSLPDMHDRTVVVSSLSKSHAVPGFRIGWTVGPPELTPHLYNLLLCAQFGAPPFLLYGAMAAFATELPEAVAMRDIYGRRAEKFAALLDAAPGCRVVRPEGGMFVLLDVRPSGLSSEAWATGLLHDKGVAALACDAFGPSAVGHLRLSLTVDDKRLEEAAARIVEFARARVQ